MSDTAEDRALAAACLAGDPAALARLETEVLAPAARALERQGFAASTINEAMQLARVRLLVGSEAAPVLAAYRGEGPLRRFVSVVLTHAVLLLVRRGPVEPASDQELAPGMGALSADLETAFSRAEERAVVKQAVHRAIEQMPPRQRALLRFQLVDGLRQADIAAIYGVSRATMGRWLDDTRGRLASLVRQAVAAQLGPSGLEDLLLSQIDLSLSRVLGDA